MTTPATAHATTKETITQYFHRLQDGGDWRSLFSDDMVFTIRTSPGRQIEGRDAFLQGTAQFYGMIADTQVIDIMIDGQRACVLTRYRLQPPNGGAAFESDVAEVFNVRDGAIDALTIYFDTGPYPKR